MKQKNLARQSDIDILKGFGILFVVIGHMGMPQLIGGSISTWIYNFHMPLFFAVSGYLSYAKLNMGFAKYAAKKAKNILLPYVFFFFFSFVWTNTLYARLNNVQIFHFPFTWPAFFKALFLSGGYLDKIPLMNFPLWFLPLMFIASCVFYLIIKVQIRFFPLIIGVLLVFLTVPIQSIPSIVGRPAFHINALPAALVFMLLGYAFKMFAISGKASAFLSKSLNSFTGFALIFPGILLTHQFGGVISQINSPVYFLLASATILGFYCFSKETGNKVLASLGNKSLYIFSLHTLVFLQLPRFKVTGIAAKLSLNGVLEYSFYVASVLALSLALTLLIEKLMQTGGFFWQKYFNREVNK